MRMKIQGTSTVITVAFRSLVQVSSGVVGTTVTLAFATTVVLENDFELIIKRQFLISELN